MTKRSPVLSDVTRQIESWYLGERNNQGASEFNSNLDTNKMRKMATIIGIGTYGQVGTFQFNGKPMCAKFIRIPVGIDSIQHYWGIRVPRDVLIPIEMQMHVFTSRIIDIKVQNTVNFDVVNKIPFMNIRYEDFTYKAKDPHPKNQNVLMERNYNPTTYSEKLDTLLKCLTHRGTNTIYYKSTDMNSQFNLFVQSCDLYARFTVLMDKCDGDLKAFQNENHGLNTTLRTRLSIKILNCVMQQMIEMYDKMKVVYADMKLDNVLYKKKEDTYSFYIGDFGSFYHIGDDVFETFSNPLGVDVQTKSIITLQNGYVQKANPSHALWSLYVLYFFLFDERQVPEKENFLLNTNGRKNDVLSKNVINLSRTRMSQFIYRYTQNVDLIMESNHFESMLRNFYEYVITSDIVNKFPAVIPGLEAPEQMPWPPPDVQRRIKQERELTEALSNTPNDIRKARENTAPILPSIPYDEILKKSTQTYSDKLGVTVEIINVDKFHRLLDIVQEHQSTQHHPDTSENGHQENNQTHMELESDTHTGDNVGAETLEKNEEQGGAQNIAGGGEGASLRPVDLNADTRTRKERVGNGNEVWKEFLFIRNLHNKIVNSNNKPTTEIIQLAKKFCQKYTSVHTKDFNIDMGPFFKHSLTELKEKVEDWWQLFIEAVEGVNAYKSKQSHALGGLGYHNLLKKICTTFHHYEGMKMMYNGRLLEEQKDIIKKLFQMILGNGNQSSMEIIMLAKRFCETYTHLHSKDFTINVGPFLSESSTRAKEKRDQSWQSFIAAVSDAYRGMYSEDGERENSSILEAHDLLDKVCNLFHLFEATNYIYNGRRAAEEEYKKEKKNNDKKRPRFDARFLEDTWYLSNPTPPS